MHKDIKEIIISEKDIVKKSQELGKMLTHDYQGKCPVLVGLLKGCVPFLAELMKHMEIDLEYDFMDVSSYFGGTSSSGQIKILKDLETNINGRDVIIVEDIVDTGFTLHNVIPMLKKRNPKSIEIVSLLDKPVSRTVDDINPKYVGYTIPKLFVVGYGLDYNDLYRNLPYIGILKEEVYTKWNQLL